MEDEDVALAISAYESAFCANIVAHYAFEMTEISFLQSKHRGDYLQFAMKVWSPTTKGKDKTNEEDKDIQMCSPMEKWLKQCITRKLSPGPTARPSPLGPTY
eukprot:6682123-Ditylum_brightwellii.AAC.1